MKKSNRRILILGLLLFIFSTISLNGVNESRKIRPGLYRAIISSDHNAKYEQTFTIDSLLNDRLYETYLFDGKYFRSTGGEETTPVKKRKPFSEYSFCGKELQNLCPKYNGLPLKILDLEENGNWFDCFSNKHNPTERWVRINDDNLAIQFIEKTELLHLFPGKKISDFDYVFGGYIESVVK